MVPIIENNEPSFKRLPEKKFRCIALNFTLPAGFGQFKDVSIEFPFPKKDLQSLWEAFVAPVDTYIDGSEYWPYMDNTTGEVKQGLMFTPVKKFGILSNLPRAIIWFDIIVAIAAILTKAGLPQIAANFYQRLIVWVRNRQIVNSIRTLDEKVDDAVEDIDVIETTVNDNHTLLHSLDTKVGVRMVIR